MRKLITCILSLVPMVMCAQSRADMATSDSLFASGVGLYQQGKYEDAIPLFKESDRIDKARLDETSNRRHYSAMWLASCYYMLGDTATAAKHYKFYSIPPVDRRLTVKSDSLLQLGTECYNGNDYAKALQYYSEAEKTERSILDDSRIFHSSYTILLIADCYSRLNDARALEYAKRYSDIIRKCLGAESEHYGISLSDMALYHADYGKYDEAKSIEMEAMGIFKKIFGKRNIRYANSLSNMALYNAGQKNYGEAVRFETEAMNIYGEILGKDNPEYANSLCLLSDYEFQLGNFDEAIRFRTEACNIYEKTFGKESPEYANSLNYLALYLSEKGDHGEAVMLGTEALRAVGKIVGKESIYYATSLSRLASYEAKQGNYDAAIRHETEALEIKGEVSGKGHYDYSASLSNLATYYYLSGKHDEALQLGTRALEISKRILGRDNPEYITLLRNVADYNAALGHYDKAAKMETEALETNEKIFGKENIQYANSLLNLSVYCKKAGNKKASKYYADAMELIPNIFKRSFIGSNANKKDSLCKQYGTMFEPIIHRIAYESRSDAYYKDGYDSALMGKGMSLDNGMDLDSPAKEDESNGTKTMYNSLADLYSRINNIYELPKSGRPAGLDSLKNEARRLNEKLQQCHDEYGDFIRNLSTDWQQVRQTLGDYDLAVEFVTFPAPEDSLIYAAYCLRKGMDSPKMYLLFEGNELKHIDKQNLYNTTTVGKLVWKPLENELQNVENVYFAPSGALNDMAIESVPQWNGEGLMSDKWKMHRLASTGKLVSIRKTGN